MLAHVDVWQIAKDKQRRRLRDAAYVIPPQASDSESDTDSESAENIPLAKLAKKCRHERETSSKEEDIPLWSLMELRKILRHRESRQNQNEETEVKDMECNDEFHSDNASSLPFVRPNNSDVDMDVNEVHSLPSSHWMKSVKSVERRKRHQEPCEKSQDK